MMTIRASRCLHRLPDRVRELAGRQLGRIDLLEGDRAALDVRFAGRCPGRRSGDSSVCGLSSKMNNAARWPRPAAAAANCAASVDLPVPAAPTISVLVPSSMPPPSSASSSAMPLASCRVVVVLPMLGRDQARKHLEAARLDHVVVVAAAESDARDT